MDKRIVDYAKFLGFRQPATDMTREEQIRHYMKQHDFTREQAILWLDEILSDQVEEFFWAQRSR
jgi:hypothetical protein